MENRDILCLYAPGLYEVALELLPYSLLTGAGLTLFRV